jgi:o-succinylbenzoate synthase
LKVFPYRIPLCSPLTTAHGTLAIRQGAILEILTVEGITGIGELAPLPEFGGGTLNDALAALHQSDLVDKGLDEALDCLYRTGGRLPASTICGLEMALLDALGQAQQCSISELLFQESQFHTARPFGNIPITPRNHVLVNAVIGASTIHAAVCDALSAVAAGFRCLKLKLGLGVKADIERVHAVRQALGPNIHLRLDANEAWDFDQASTILTKCAPFDIQYVEQPLKASDLTGMHMLRKAIPIPIAADEAIEDLASARRVLDAQAADVLILKPQLLGGLSISRQIIQEATQQGVQCVVTSAIETGIGMTGILHLIAALPEVTLECGLATLHLLEDDLLIEALSIENGLLTVPTGAGLGIHLDRQALATYALARKKS